MSSGQKDIRTAKNQKPGTAAHDRGDVYKPKISMLPSPLMKEIRGIKNFSFPFPSQPPFVRFPQNFTDG